MPYNLEINDSIVYAVERHATGELLSRIERTLLEFETECTRQVRVFAIGLHPHLIAVPHRIGELRRALDFLRRSTQTHFTTGSELCDWFTAASPPI